MNRATHALLLIPLASALLYACSSSDDDDGPAPGYEDVVYQGKVTDESVVALVSALEQGTPTQGGPGAPKLTAPIAAELWPDIPEKFTWTLEAATARRDPAGLLRPWERAASAPAWSTPLRELFGPMRAAHAHGEAYTGYATLLVFSTAADAKLLRVFTNESTYIPEKDVWQRLKDAKAPITLTLTGANFEDNRLAQGTKPLQGVPFTFTIAAP